MIYDPVGDQIVTFGGADPLFRGDVWALSLASNTWTRLLPSGEQPPVRVAASAVYDPVGRRMVVFGGFGPDGFLDDVWSLSLSGQPQWSRLSPNGEPPSGRGYHSAVYDPVGNQMIVFGGARGFGVYGPHFNDTWTLSLWGTPTWSRIAVQDSIPPVRSGHLAVFEPEHRVMLIFGGLGSYAGATINFLNDVWELKLTGTPEWTRIKPAGSGPPGSLSFTGEYDPNGRRLVVVEGWRSVKTWALSVKGRRVWKELSARGDAPPFPAKPAVYDPLRKRLIIYSGEQAPGVWALTVGKTFGWSELPAIHSVPSGRWFHSAVYDSIRQRMVVFGGTQVNLEPSPNPYYLAISDQTWSLPLHGNPQWTLIDARGLRPRGQGHVAIFDPVGDRVIVFGLCSGTTMGSYPMTCSDEVWNLSWADGPTWTRVMTSGTPPVAERSTLAILDPPRRRMIVLGDNGTAVVHALSLDGDPVWTLIPSTGDVPVAFWRSYNAFYDSEADQMIVLDERAGNLWSVSLGGNPMEWKRLPTSADAPKLIEVSFFDPVRRQVVAFQSPGTLVQAWTYDVGRGGSWKPTTASGSAPYHRQAGSVIYDPVFDRAVLFGGFIRGPDWGMIDWMFSDTWSLSRGAPTQEVAIDIEPADQRNRIPFHSRGMTAVAVLGSSFFAVDSIVTSTVTLAGAPPKSAGDREIVTTWRDVNGDGHMDLIIGIDTESMRLGPDDTLAVLKANTKGGGRIVGFDRVRFVPRNVGTAGDSARTEVSTRLSLRSGNPVIGGRPCVFEYSLPLVAPARIELIDIMGRRVALRELSGAVTQTGRVELRETRTLPPGVYLARLTQERQAFTTRAVIVK